MKNYKRSLAILTAAFLAATPLAATGLTAIAAPTAGTSTLTITDTDPTEHTYKAYQLITGTTEAGKLKDLAWGSGVDSAALITALNTNKTALGLTNDIAADASVQTVAEALSTITGDADKSVKLAKVIQGCVTEDAITMSKSSDSYSAPLLADGWYLVLDESDPLVDGDTDGVKVRSANVLKMIGDTTINSKHSLPTLDKVIDDGSTNGVKANTAAIGDVITYKIKTTVPDVRGYDKYFYVVEDTLSSGLTYNEGTLGVTVSGNPVIEDTDGVGTDVETGDFYVTHEGTKITVVFKNAVEYFAQDGMTVGDPIVITYTATLNSNAVITDDGNPNTASLVYSNDPNETGEGTNKPGKPDEPSDSSPKGETPVSTVNTYTTAVKLFKKDQEGHKLTGAGFTLTGANLVDVKVVSGSSFEPDADGTYYLLKDGTYTTSAPVTEGTGANADLYQSTTAKYKKVDTSGTFTEATGGTSVYAMVDDDGYIVFSGLKPGEYTLSETTVPGGYNAASDITFTITATGTPVNGPSQWTTDNTNVTYRAADNAFYVEIENRLGATLPSTGGIGTKLFYIFGSLLVVGSGVLLITKKRMNAKEN